MGHGSGLLLHLTKGPCDWYYQGVGPLLLPIKMTTSG